MSQDERITPLLRQFEDPEIEQDFRKFVFKENLATNRLGVSVGVPLFFLYAILDFINLEHPVVAVAVRVAATLLCALMIMGMYHRALARFHEELTAMVVVVLGSAMTLIIWREPSLDNAYYIGLIQAGVFLTFLSRMVTYKAFAALIWIVVMFAFAVRNKEDVKQAVLQTFILMTMFAIFAFGIVVADGMRRKDFLKSRTIAIQNEKLNRMLADVRQDNARKVAAMNLLVHFVKTPIHQIVGFTDVIRRQIEHPEAAEKLGETLESAAFIQAASRDLSRNVSRLLAYYRLDDKAGAQPDLVELDALILDHAERLDRAPAMKLHKVAIVNRREIIGDAMQTMIDRYADNQESSTLVEIRLERVEGAALIVFIDEGPALSDEEFARQTKPLDKLDHYLTANGSSMLLGLRTVARAVEICGGSIRYRREDRRNVFFIEVRDLAATQDVAAVA